MRTMPESEDGFNPIPFATVLKRLTVRLINAVADPMEREDRIQVALQEGALTYSEAYQLRTDGEL